MDLYFRWLYLRPCLLSIIVTHKKAALKVAFLFFILSSIAVLYYPGLWGPFLLDDLQNLSEAKIRGPFWAEWFRVSFANNSGPFGRSLSVASLALNEYWLGSEAFGYKLVNLAIHLTIGILIYTLVYKLILRVNNPINRNHPSSAALENNPPQKAIFIAALSASLWLIHPLQVSTVLYSVQRMAQMGTLFLVLGMLFYVQGRWKASILCWPLAIFSKETGVLLPFYLLTIEYFLPQPYFSTTKKSRLYYLFLWCVFTTFFACVYYILHYGLYKQAFFNKGYTLTQQIFTQIEIICFYIRLIWMPSLGQMGLFHDDFLITQHITFTLVFSLICFVGLLLLIFKSKNKHPILAFGLCFFLLSHLVESTVLPLELVFEHRNYLALLGLVLIPSYYLVHFLVSLSKPWVTGIILVTFCGTLGWMTQLRVASWANVELFLQLELLAHPHSARAHVEWANFLMEQHQFTQADNHLKKAAQLAPHNAGITIHRLLLQCTHDAAHNSRVMSTAARLHEALQATQHKTITPYAILVLDNIVRNLVIQSCPELASEDILKLINASIDNPRTQSQKNYLATLYHLRAGIHMLHDNVYAALCDLDTAYKLYPKRLAPLLEKAKIQIMITDYQGAKKTLNKVSELAQTQWISDRALLIQLTQNLEMLGKTGCQKI